MTRRTVLAVLALLLVSACSPGAGRPAPSPPTVGAACADESPRGYALTGDVYHALLRPVTLCPLTFGPPILGPGEVQRMSYLTGTGARAVVAEYSTGTDRIALVTPDRLVPVPGLGSVAGHAPSLSPDGRLAYVERRPGRADLPFAVRVFDPTSGKTYTALRLAVPPSGAAWGPSGELAVIADAGGPTAHLLVVDRIGAPARKVTALPRGAVDVFWPASGGFVIVLSGTSPELSRALLLDASGDERAVVAPDWRPVGLLSDGALLAVRGRTLARLAAPDYDVPDVYGDLPDGEQVWRVVV